MNDYETFTFLGASIGQGYFDTEGQGWVSRLFKKLNAERPGHYYLANLAQSGDRSYDYLHRLCGEAVQRQTDHLMIEVTGNDLIRFHSPDHPCALSFEVIEELWLEILAIAQKNFKRVIVFSGLPRNESRLPGTGPNDWKTYYKNDDLKKLNEKIKSLCAKRDVVFLDSFDELNAVPYLSTVTDGIHPDSKGHEIIAATVFDKVKKAGI